MEGVVSSALRSKGHGSIGTPISGNSIMAYNLISGFLPYGKCDCTVVVLPGCRYLSPLYIRKDWNWSQILYTEWLSHSDVTMTFGSKGHSNINWVNMCAVWVIYSLHRARLVHGMGDCLRAGKLSHYVTSHPGQLSLSSFRVDKWVVGCN